LPKGKCTVRVEFTPEESGYGKPAGKLGMSRDGTTLELARTSPVAPWAIQ
jgi:hypothetical protein